MIEDKVCTQCFKLHDDFSDGTLGCLCEECWEIIKDESWWRRVAKNYDAKEWIFVTNERFGGSIKLLHSTWIRETRNAKFSCDLKKYETFKRDLKNIEEIFNLESTNV